MTLFARVTLAIAGAAVLCLGSFAWERRPKGPVCTNPAIDLKAMRGRWDLIYFEQDGKEVILTVDTRLFVKGEKFVLRRDDKVVATGTMKLITGTWPRAFDVTYTEGAETGMTFKAIYETHRDAIKFSRAGKPSDKRPTEFKTLPDSGQFVSIYKRTQN